MSHPLRRRPWDRPHLRVTDESAWLARRQILRAMGVSGAAAALAALASGPAAAALRRRDDEPAADGGPVGIDPDAEVPDGVFPAPRDVTYGVPGRAITKESVAGRYNNFYEFTLQKDRVWRLVDDFSTRPWTVEVGGLVREPRTFDVDELLTDFAQEERVYRFRCVEAWAMVVPWTGFPLRALLDRVEPRSSARYVRFVTVHDEQAFPGARAGPYADAFPYYEGLTMAEARHPLTLLATGIYGHQLPRQHGAPVRLVVPWKYGYKSAKSIVRVECVAERPATFWNDLVPHEYGFVSNVDPDVPHPRWSQATERLIDTGERVDTLPFNGYGEWVADLYR